MPSRPGRYHHRWEKAGEVQKSFLHRHLLEGEQHTPRPGAAPRERRHNISYLSCSIACTTTFNTLCLEFSGGHGDMGRGMRPRAKLAFVAILSFCFAGTLYGLVFFCVLSLALYRNFLARTWNSTISAGREGERRDSWARRCMYV